MDEDLMLEQEVAEKVGVSRDVLKTVRAQELTANTDWHLVRGMIAYTKEGVAKVLGKLGLTPAAPEAGLCETDPHPGPLPLAGEGDGGRALIPDVYRGAGEGVETRIEREASKTEQREGMEAIAIMEKSYKNPHIIGCRLLGQGRVDQAGPHPGPLPKSGEGKDLVRVRVKEGKNFLRGMRLPVRHVQADLWELVGRCPRNKGKW